jgi:AmiR/NasT family two-component response regulator
VRAEGTKLPRKQECAIAPLLCERTHADAARAAGVSESTLQRWLLLPGFRRAYRAARPGPPPAARGGREPFEDLDGIAAAEAVNRDRPVPVVLLSAHHEEDILSRLGGTHVMSYLVKPVGEADLKVAVALAMLRFRHLQALTMEGADLRQALEDRKVIERAKGALMRRLRVDEEEAFRRLRSLASEHNLKLVEVGRRIVAAEEVFSQLDRI